MTRRHPNDERPGKTFKKEFKVKITGKEVHTAYLTVSFYEDGSICEFFITVGKIGGSLRAALDCWAIACSCLIQRGGLEDVIEKFEFQRFLPYGRIKPQIPYKSIETGEMDKYRSVVSIADWVSKKLRSIRDCGITEES